MRARLYMEREEDTDKLVLHKRKSNYSNAGDSIEFSWHDGALIPYADMTGFMRTMRADMDSRIEVDFLFLLRRAMNVQKIRVSNSKYGNWAPKILANIGKTYGVTWNAGQYEQAMNRLFDSGAIRLEEDGRNRTASIVITDVGAARLAERVDRAAQD